MTAPPLPPSGGVRPATGGRFRDPGVRNYLVVGGAALALVAVAMVQRESDIGAVMLTLIGGAGIALRWPAAPGFFLVVLMYFLIFPFGTPDIADNINEIEEGRFRAVDLLLVAAVVVYLAAHHRLLGFAEPNAPPGQPAGRADGAVLRPPALIHPGEIARMLVLAAAVVLAGQLLWLGVTVVEIDPLASFPIQRAGPPPAARVVREGIVPPVIARSVLLIGLAFFVTLVARLVLGYWRLRLMSPIEARMVLQDTAWDETRREQVRVAWWRAGRGRKRATPPARGGERAAPPGHGNA